MTFTDLRNKALNEYYPALFLEKVWPRGRGQHVVILIRTFWGIFLVLFALLYGASKTAHYASLAPYVSQAFGGLLVMFGAWLGVVAIRGFYLSYYYRSQPIGNEEKPPMSFELARILYQTPTGNLLKGFVESDEGFKIMLRTGVSPDEVVEFVNKQPPEALKDLPIPDDGYTSVGEYAGAIFDTHKEFAQFLFAKGIQKKDFVAISEWVIEREIAERTHERWWSRERLGRVPGLGKDWSYGQIHTLEKYERSIPELEGEEYEVHDVYGSKELSLLESILSKNRTSNAVIVGDDMEGNIHIVARLKRLIETGHAMPQLEHKRLIMLDADRIASSAKSKGEFESLLISVFVEAHNAGNVILVLADFPAFIQSAEAFNSDLASILDQYLASADLQIIALSDADRFHSKIERNAALMERFEKVLVEGIDELNTVRVLENEIIPLEMKSGIFFTYQALLAIADSAERYFPDGVMPDRAVSLLFEIAPKIVAQGRHAVKKEDILELVKTKTGIPIGKVNDDEREKLLHLEEILHQRIIGQDQAVLSISNAVRRARSGINNPNRPLASFLFLGPTGVGKTETTKALAEIFFGKSANVERLDMSEYSGTEALSKLIGSFEGGRPGVLASMVREHPYGVLLLDEFEKTTPEVMNLFLQVLDEGFFSDMTGKKVNARNLLIIATSNAGSDLIWEAMKQGEDPSLFKDLVVDNIISAHIMKPELINRFDGVIVFHPLGRDHLEKIARLQLEKLAGRLAERGVKLAITDDLVKYLMTYGTDPKFGARPMNRAIQDSIEQVIAEKMIRGDVSPGAEVALTSADLKDLKR